MLRLQGFFRELGNALNLATDWQKKIGLWIALAVAIGGSTIRAWGPDKWMPEQIKQLAPCAAFAIFGWVAGWAWSRSMGAAIGTTDLLADAYGRNLGVRVVNRGRSQIVPRIHLITITTADRERQVLMHSSRPIVTDNGPPTLSIFGQTAFVPILSRWSIANLPRQIGACVSPVAAAAEPGPPVPLSNLISRPFHIPVLLTIGMDCGDGIDGNVIHRTFRIEPRGEASCNARRHLPKVFDLARSAVRQQVRTVSFSEPIAMTNRLDRFIGRWSILPSASEPTAFVITLDPALGATKSHRPGINGVWTIQGDEARIMWEDEWWDALRPQIDGSALKHGYFGPRKRWEEPPVNEQKAMKLPD